MLRSTPNRLAFLLSAAIAAATISGCKDSSEPPSATRRGEPFLRCAALRDDGVKEIHEIAPMVLSRDGYELEVKGADRGTVVFGLLAGLDEPCARTMENISFFLDRFKAAEVQAILVAGGIGLMERDVLSNLEALAAAPVPVLVSLGAQESFDAARAAIAKARKRSPQIVDMTLVRRARIGHVTVISLPGYHNTHYLEAKDRGCSYEEADLADVAGLKREDGIDILLSASPPRGSGAASADRGRGGVNIGDTALAAMMKKTGFGLGFFGHVYEAGGGATEADGATPVPEGAWRESLFLQAGGASAVPIRLNDGGLSVGMAQIVEIHGPRARFRRIMAASAPR